jgi:hypothetical protein
VFFGEVVELDGFQRFLGDAFGAVADGGDGGLADEAGGASDAAGDALVEVGGVAGECPGFVLGQVEVCDEVIMDALAKDYTGPSAVHAAWDHDR